MHGELPSAGLALTASMTMGAAARGGGDADDEDDVSVVTEASDKLDTTLPHADTFGADDGGSAAVGADATSVRRRRHPHSAATGDAAGHDAARPYTVAYPGVVAGASARSASGRGAWGVGGSSGGVAAAPDAVDAAARMQPVAVLRRGLRRGIFFTVYVQEVLVDADGNAVSKGHRRAVAERITCTEVDVTQLKPNATYRCGDTCSVSLLTHTGVLLTSSPWCALC
jgi:hypothetical protein